MLRSNDDKKDLSGIYNMCQFIQSIKKMRLYFTLCLLQSLIVSLFFSSYTSSAGRCHRPGWYSGGACPPVLCLWGGPL